MKPVTIVVLGKYYEVFKGFLETSEIFAKDYKKILIRDGEDIPTSKLDSSWTVIQGPKEFAMAGNGNLGLKAAPADSDILYCGDDVRFLKKDTIKLLQEAAYKDSAIGLLSPRIIGRGSPSQVTPMAEVSEVPPLEMWFPCIYFKREIIEVVGYLDEQFNKFGSDDLDYCLRVRQNGYKLCVLSTAVVKHEASPDGGPTTFVKKIGVGEWQKQQAEAINKLITKYDCPPNVLDRIVKTGDVEYLTLRPTDFRKRVSAGEQPPREECEKFLKSRHLFIGTPAYGGNCQVNYVSSLVTLINICQDLGIKYTTSFIHNESLITRARNKIADEFLKTDGTDFFWVDADIGFDARDIITMMMYDEDVISFPCVRKNLRVDRVVQNVKREFVQEVSEHLGKDETIWPTQDVKNILNQVGAKNGHDTESLEALMGEFVLNFIPGQTPEAINLGKLCEVMDGGSGLMRIKRETFTTIQEKFPKRWVMQLFGEAGGRKPIYMFFQAEPSDPIEGQEYPDYISEDFSFCRLVRKAGMKVWVAPWTKTTHAGTYIYKGDPKSVALAGGSIR